MATPPAVRAVILAVDDDPAVGRAIERDLRHRYGSRHRVLLADSGEAALGLVEQVVRRGEPVALLVADQRMPGMSGVEFLARALTLAPAGQAGAPDRVRGHRGRDPGDQRARASTTT